MMHPTPRHLAQYTSTPLNYRGAIRSRQSVKRRGIWDSTLICNKSSSANATIDSRANRPCLRQLLVSDSDVYIFDSTSDKYPVRPPRSRSFKQLMANKLCSPCLSWKHMSARLGKSCLMRFLSFFGQTLIFLVSIPLWLVVAYIVIVEYIFTALGSGNRIPRTESIC
ncbi:uncharacterized protein LOC134213975 [Armigeres subalbatus]|uniref:uncharacterized protein LOC134213975 n=1 Tax=Armigeres subalbatus TaxID=124917 RepID=UPI002ED47B4A